MESAFVRLADGINCTILRCGKSGEYDPQNLIERGQLSHIYDKAGIDEVEIIDEPGQNRINVVFALDPNINPDITNYVGPSFREIEQLRTGKLRSLEPDYARFFNIDHRSSAP